MSDIKREALVHIEFTAPLEFVADLAAPESIGEVFDRMERVENGDGSAKEYIVPAGEECIGAEDAAYRYRDEKFPDLVDGEDDDGRVPFDVRIDVDSHQREVADKLKSNVHHDATADLEMDALLELELQHAEEEAIWRGLGQGLINAINNLARAIRVDTLHRDSIDRR